MSWINAIADNFPASGITVTLPYPDGTGKELQDFAVSHMFTVTSSAWAPWRAARKSPPPSRRTAASG